MLSTMKDQKKKKNVGCKLKQVQKDESETSRRKGDRDIKGEVTKKEKLFLSCLLCYIKDLIYHQKNSQAIEGKIRGMEDYFF